MYSERDLSNAPYWKHPKTGSYYKVLFVAMCSTNGERNGKERSVVYQSADPLKPQIYYREISEFLDGRFVPVNNIMEVPVTSK